MRLDTALLPKPFQLSALTGRELHLESPWKRFIVRGRDEVARRHRRGGRGSGAVPARHGERGHHAFRATIRCCSAMNAALARCLPRSWGFSLCCSRADYARAVFGARLTLRLLARFAALAVVPGLIVYAVSVQFLTRSIESWFDVKVDAALEGGINLGQQVIEQMTLELRGEGERDGRRPRRALAGRLATQLERLRAQQADEAVVVGHGQAARSAAHDVAKLVPELPTRHALRQGRVMRAFTAVDAALGRPLALRVIVSSGNAGRGALPAAAQQRAGHSRATPRRWRLRIRDYQRARDRARRAEAHLRRDADLRAADGVVRRGRGVATRRRLLAEPPLISRRRRRRWRAAISAPRAGLPAATSSACCPSPSTRRPGSSTRRARGVGRTASRWRRSARARKHPRQPVDRGAGVRPRARRLPTQTAPRRSSATSARGSAAAQWTSSTSDSQARERLASSSCSRGPARRCTRAAQLLPRATGGGHVVVFDDITRLIRRSAGRRVGRGGAAARARDQEPAHADPASAERLEMKLADRLSRGGRGDARAGDARPSSTRWRR